MAARWPFRKSAIVQDLEEAASGRVEIRTFRHTYFPYPGCVAEGLTYRLSPNAPPFATVEKLTIQSSLPGLFAGRVRRIRADALHIYVPAPGSKEKFRGLNSGTTHVGEIILHDAVLEVPRNEVTKPVVKFVIHDLTMGPVSVDSPIHFSAMLSNPEPPGEIAVSGQFGPWKGLQTSVAGDYRFENADLGAFDGIAGILFSQGKFSGVLQHIDVAGKISIPEFEVARSQHKVALDSDFTAYVDGANGDTFLNQVSSRFLKTTVISQGKIAGHTGQKGKTATIDLQAQNGRIEDVLRLFTQEPQPPMAGGLNFKGTAVLPPGPIRFLKKIELEGDFGISDSNFTHGATQEKVNQLSQSAKTEDLEKLKSRNKEKENDNAPAPPVLSDLHGHVILKGGTATFSNLSFYIPGAHAQMHGTYSLISEKIDLHGTLKMDSDLSDTAHGVKAVMLKVLDPFFKKKHGGSDVPVKVTGSYHNPSFGMDVGKAGKRLVSGK